MKMLGPSVGYTLASICLKMYILPDLTPTIDNKDTRWLGAWWLGWLILGSILTFFGLLMMLFPKELPRAAVRRKIAMGKENFASNNEKQNDEGNLASFKDMMVTFKRLLKNKTYMLNTMATVFTTFGSLAYWIFNPKYMETQFKQSASKSRFL